MRWCLSSDELHLLSFCFFFPVRCQINSAETGNGLRKIEDAKEDDQALHVSESERKPQSEAAIAVEQLCSQEPVPAEASTTDQSSASPNLSAGIKQESETDSSKAISGDHFLCFCAPGEAEEESMNETKSEQDFKEESLVKEPLCQSNDDESVHSREASKSGLLGSIFSWPTLCFSKREDHEDRRETESLQVEASNAPMSSLLKENRDDSETAASSISLAQSSTGSDTSSSASDESATSDDYSAYETDDSTLATTRKARKKSYKLTVTFEPPTWLV
jgi:hypothetical protein